VKFYSHWVRLRSTVETPRGQRTVSALGWSDDGDESARTLAQRRLSALVERLGAGLMPPHDYDYAGERPPPEPVLERVLDESGQVLAVVTRNAYGARVLNTDRALFIDVDFAEGPPQGFFKSLFGKAPTPEQAALERVEQASHTYPGWAFRVYRTFAGLRLVLLNESLSGFEEQQLAVLDHFGSDPLYRKLCVAQRCFRARLTPKPWRMDLSRPPSRFPFSSPEESHRFDAWLARYEQSAAGYSACELRSNLGLGHPSRTVAAILAAHDAIAVRSGAPLA
jgi:hypothetical protein